MKMILNWFFDFLPGGSISDDSSTPGSGEIIIILGSAIFALGIPWGHVFGYIGAGIVFFGAIISPGLFRFRYNEKLLLIAFLLLFAWGIFLSFAVAIQPSQGYQTVFAYFSHWLIPFVIGLWIPLRYKARILHLWIISLFVLGFISFLAFSGFYNVPSLSREGMLFGLHNHIQFAALLLLGFNIVYGLFLTPDNSKKTNLLLGIGGTLLLLFFILTGSRGWWIAALISIGGMTFHHVIINRRRKTAVILLVAGILFAAGSIIVFPQVRVRIEKTNFNDPNYIHRRNMAIMAWEVIKDNPVTGIGPGQTPLIKAYYERMEIMNLPQETGYLEKKHFHNIYLQITAEFGLPGFILFLFVLFMCFKILFSASARNIENHETGIIYGVFWSFVALAVAELFDSLLRGPAVAMEYFWVLGICAGFYRVKIKRE